MTGAEILANQLALNHGTVNVNTKGLTHEDSLVAPPGGGNCLNWVLGHLVVARNGLLKGLGLDPVWEEERAERYSRGSDPITAEDALPLDEILAEFAASQETLVEAVNALTDEDLDAASPIKYLKGEDETIGTMLTTFLFHESYHVGQTGLLRRIAGKEGAIR